MTEYISRTLEARVQAAPETVWAVVTDLDRWDWRSDLERVETTGEGTFVEYARGGFPTRFTVTAAEPPHRWAFDMDNANLRGHWTGVFTATPQGTAIAFTEQVAPKKTWMKFLVKGFLSRQQARYLADLRRALGED